VARNSGHTLALRSDHLSSLKRREPGPPTIWAAWRGLPALIALAVAGCGGSTSVPPASAAPQLGKIKHVVFIIQENHTFDSIFGGPNPFPGAETASSGKTSTGATIPLQPQYMGDSGGTSGLPNNYAEWAAGCDQDPSIPLQVGQPWPCRMDGFDKISVLGGNGTDAYTYARYVSVF
jgi:hypothetical protein